MFKKITGHLPYPWQYRLYRLMMKGKFPTQLDIPTGLGKTSIMAIWLIAKSKSISDASTNIPSRLVYIVDRRVIVDQATTEAQMIADKIKGIQGLQNVTKLSISKMRGGGGTSDSREWLTHPENPAIIIGTIDMIGSRLLFSGYSLSDKIKPFYAGLLGQDSLIVLDEAHLSPAMRRSLTDIHQISLNEGQEILYPPKVLFMSATQQHGDKAEDVFRISGEDLKNSTVKDRYNAEKTVELIEAEDKLKKIFEYAKKIDGRILIYLQKPKDVKSVVEMLQGDGQDVVMLTGTLRGYERDQLVKKDTWKSFLAKNDKDGPRFLVSTSAGEVGVDLDADHMICDMTTFDSLVQRLGRVNRSGGRKSKVFIIYERADLQKGKIATQLEKTKELLESLTKNGKYNASPANISKIKSEQKQDALAPKPETQPLTIDILEMWALTSIHRQYRSLPEVGYWLRGDKEASPPETHIAWRDDVKYITASPEKAQNVVGSYRVLPHETARDYSSNVHKMLSKLKGSQDEKAIIIKPNGDCASKKILDIAEEEIRFATVILPRNVGGLDSEGFIDSAGKDVGDVADEREYRNGSRWIVEHDEERDTHRIIEDVHGNKKNQDLSEWTNDNPRMKLIEQIRIDDVEDEEVYKEIQYYVEHLERQQSKSTGEQRLEEHHGAVEAASRNVTEALSLPRAVKEAIVTASRFHDAGKAREHWQKCMRVDKDRRPLAKTGSAKQPLNLGGFRHEFASVMDCMDKPEISRHTEKDLILHLIAAHHGWARPCFMPDATLHESDQACKKKAELASADVMRRYHKLQKRFGLWGLAWLEGLVRGADWQASKSHSGGEQK